MLPKQILCIHKPSVTNPPKNCDSKSDSSDKSNIARIIKINSKKFSKLKTSFITKRNLEIFDLNLEKSYSKQKLSRKRCALKMGKQGIWLIKEKN